ncbi:MAG: hypothetical protein HYZ74_05930 [Elusimicrobia bacterium]|nr:hypothetical protein [Elusimicrobiota bacterium]
MTRPPRPAAGLALALAALSAACSGPDFPIGLYGVERPSQVQKLRDAGFDRLHAAAPSPELTRAAGRAGLRVYSHAHALSDPGGALASYAVDGEAVMVDWFPVPERPLESTGEQVRLTVADAVGKPVWAVIQAMNRADYPALRGKKKPLGRFPNMFEIRFMSYDAILAGAAGLWYFSNAGLDDRPELWFALSEVSRGMGKMGPILSRGRPIPLPFDAPAGGLRARAWSYHGRDYVVMANRTKDRLWRAPAAILERSWRPLFEVRRDPRELLKKHGDAYYLKPYQVLVLESRLSLARLLGR